MRSSGVNNGITSVSVLMLFALLLTSTLNLQASYETSGNIRAFRVLLIIGDQWNDPASYVVNLPGPTGEYSGYDASPAVPGPSSVSACARRG